MLSSGDYPEDQRGKRTILGSFARTDSRVSVSDRRCTVGRARVLCKGFAPPSIHGPAFRDLLQVPD